MLPALRVVRRTSGPERTAASRETLNRELWSAPRAPLKYLATKRAQRKGGVEDAPGRFRWSCDSARAASARRRAKSCEGTRAFGGGSWEASCGSVSCSLSLEGRGRRVTHSKYLPLPRQPALAPREQAQAKAARAKRAAFALPPVSSSRLRVAPRSDQLERWPRRPPRPLQRAPKYLRAQSCPPRVGQTLNCGPRVCPASRS